MKWEAIKRDDKTGKWSKGDAINVTYVRRNFTLKNHSSYRVLSQKGVLIDIHSRLPRPAKFNLAGLLTKVTQTASFIFERNLKRISSKQFLPGMESFSLVGWRREKSSDWHQSNRVMLKWGRLARRLNLLHKISSFCESS